MNNDIITDDEIRQIKENPGYLIPIGNFVVGIPNYFKLKSGYRVGYSIDQYPNKSRKAHISITRKVGISDPIEEDCIALAILGEGYKLGCTVGGVNQYEKTIDGGDDNKKNMVRGRRIEVR